MSIEKRNLEAFAQHGVVLRPGEMGSQAVGDCPFCEAGHGAGKFYANRATALWDCKRCGRSGNFRAFLEAKAGANTAAFRGLVAKRLGEDRGLSIESLRAWRLGWDGRQYTIPADAPGKLFDLRRYQIGGKVMSTTGCTATISGITDPGSEIVWICEGEWDGIAAWEMRNATGAEGSVYSVPGAASFPQNSVELFRGKKVRILYDNDEAGKRGAVRALRILGGVARELLLLHWPEGLPEGFDVRDLYKAKGQAAWEELQGYLKPEPLGGAPVAGVLPAAGPTAEEELEKLGNGPGLSSSEVLRRYRKYLHLPTSEVLDVLFGAALANRLDGDPIWLFLVASPGGTKTELIMTLSGAPLIKTLSSLTPKTLVSGAEGKNGADPSLLPHLNRRVLCIKDFTTILSMPQQNRDEIFGTLREVYDGHFEKAWGTGLSRSYACRFGVIAGVTPVVEKYGAANSVLGERFIRYRVPRNPRIAGDDILIDKALGNLNRESSMRTNLQETAAAVLNRKVDTENPPKFSKEMLVKLRKLAQWTAALRGVVSRDRFDRQVEYAPTSEVGTRLAKQFAKLAQGVALYRGETEITPYTYTVLCSVARGTVPDRCELVVRVLYIREKIEGVGTGVADVGQRARLDTATARAVLEDLALLRVVTARKEGYGQSIYRLSKAMKGLLDSLDLYRKEETWYAASKSACTEEPIGCNEERSEIHRILGANPARSRTVGAGT